MIMPQISHGKVETVCPASSSHRCPPDTLSLLAYQILRENDENRGREKDRETEKGEKERENETVSTLVFEQELNGLNSVPEGGRNLSRDVIKSLRHRVTDYELYMLRASG